MRFTVGKSALIQLVQTVSKAVAVRTTKQVLSGILLEANNDKLVATAYDMELGIQNTVYSNDSSKLSIAETGAIVLPARYFTDVIKKLPDDTVSIHVDSNYMTEIKSGSAEFHLHGIDSAEFPKLPTFIGTVPITISSDVLKELIRTTAFATSSSEVRPILTGIYLQCQENKLTFTATDGLRLATQSIVLQNTTDYNWSAIIPGKSLLELAKILPDSDTSITVQFTGSHSMFALGNTYFYTRLIDGSYPDTSRIIPNQYKTEVLVPTEDILGAIDRAALIAPSRENHMVRVEINDMEIIVSSSSPEIGNVTEKLNCSGKEGPDLQIAFNARYVIDALRALNSGDISIRFNSSNQPFVLRKHQNEFGLQLISPVLWR
jgi:DNA polymerase III subunit beta